MSDSAVITVVSGFVTVTTMVVGFLSLWVKLKYGVQKAEEASAKAEVVEIKIDNNTQITEKGTVAAATNAEIAARTALEAKETAKKIEDTLNGGLDSVIVPFRDMIGQLSDRITKLEVYHRENTHRVLDSINTMRLEIANISVRQSVQQERDQLAQKPVEQK